jgi:hypothetical protein
MLVITNIDKLSFNIRRIFDVRKVEIPEDIKELMEGSIKIGFIKDEKPRILIIKGDESKLEKFISILMRLLLNGNRVIYKHPAVRGGVILDKEWKKGLLRISRGAIVLDNSPVRLCSVRDIKTELKEVGRDRVEVLNVRMMNSGEAISSYIYLPDRKAMNLLGRYIAFEYGGMLRTLQKLKISDFEKQIMQAVYSGLAIEDLPAIINSEAADIQRIVNNLEEKNLLKNGRLTPVGEVAVSRFVEDINV